MGSCISTGGKTNAQPHIDTNTPTKSAHRPSDTSTYPHSSGGIGSVQLWNQSVDTTTPNTPTHNDTPSSARSASRALQRFYAANIALSSRHASSAGNYIPPTSRQQLSHHSKSRQTPAYTQPFPRVSRNPYVRTDRHTTNETYKQKLDLYNPLHEPRDSTLTSLNLLKGDESMVNGFPISITRQYTSKPITQDAHLPYLSSYTPPPIIHVCSVENVHDCSTHNNQHNNSIHSDINNSVDKTGRSDSNDSTYDHDQSSVNDHDDASYKHSSHTHQVYKSNMLLGYDETHDNEHQTFNTGGRTSPTSTLQNSQSHIDADPSKHSTLFYQQHI